MCDGPTLRPRRSRPGGVLWLCVASALAATLARAQEGTASLAGTVVDATTRAPIVGAAAVLAGTRSSATTDSGGRFAFAALAAGSYVLQVHFPGYALRTDTLRLAEGEASQVVVQLQVQTLAPVVVAGERNPVVGGRFQEFERRRKNGRGFYLTRDEITRKNASTVADLLRTVRGMREDCTGGRCVVRSVRSMPGCEPQYFIDGRKAGSFGPSTPLRDIYAIELYRGPSETPAEFIDGNAACGVIVIWTRAAP